MSISEKITHLKNIKKNLKDKFERYGVSMKYVLFYDYPKCIDELLPCLFNLTISKKNNILKLNDYHNGDFIEKNNLYDNYEKIMELDPQIKEINLLDFSCGEHLFYVIPTAEKFRDGNYSNFITYNIYKITQNLQGLTTTLCEKAGEFSTVTGIISVEGEGYLPRDVQVIVGENKGEYVYNSASGEIIISNVIGDVQIIASKSDLPNFTIPTNVSVYYNEITWDRVEDASSYKVYADGNFVCELQDNYVNLSNYLQPEADYLITVTALKEGYQESSPSQSVVVSVQNLFPIYGVSGLNDNTTSELVRTRDAKNLGFFINSASGEIVSDFDDKFPYNEMQEVTINGNSMVKVPKMYFKIGVNENNILTDVAVSRYPREGGNWFESKEFYIGKYTSTFQDGTFKSLSNVKYIANGSLDYMIENLKTNYGENCFVLDHQHKNVLALLFLIEYANKNCHFILTKRRTHENTGATDTISTPSAVNFDDGVFKYRHIEDLIGGKTTILNGLKINKGIYYVADSNGIYNNINKSATVGDNWVSGLEWVNEYPFILLPTEQSENKVGSFYAKSKVVMYNEYVLPYNGFYNEEEGAGLFKFEISNKTNTAYSITRFFMENLNDN